MKKVIPWLVILGLAIVAIILIPEVRGLASGVGILSLLGVARAKTSTIDTLSNRAESAIRNSNAEAVQSGIDAGLEELHRRRDSRGGK